MMAVAPNLTTMVGELVGARLIAHAGSLLNLAKHPSSTVQILGAEKALFRCVFLWGGGGGGGKEKKRKGSTRVGRLLSVSLACGRLAGFGFPQDILCKLCVYLILGCSMYIHVHVHGGADTCSSL